jgi:RNA polymerase sigma-70 factor, ECF subfamily
VLAGAAAAGSSGRAGRRTERRLDDLSDTELLANYLAAGDREQAGVWVQELFRRHYPRVVGWCLRFTGDREEAYDLAQTIFAKACRHLESFRGQSKLSTWLYSITRSECMNHLKSRSRQPAPAEAGDLDDLPDHAAARPDQGLEQQAWSRFVQGLLDQALDDTEKKVFTLHYGDEVPLDSITRLLGLSNRSGAKAYIVSARRKLRRAVRLWKARKEVLDA